MKKIEPLRAGMSFEEVIRATTPDFGKHTHDKTPEKRCHACQLESLFSETSALLMRSLIKVVPKEDGK